MLCSENGGVVALYNSRAQIHLAIKLPFVNLLSTLPVSEFWPRGNKEDPPLQKAQCKQMAQIYLSKKLALTCRLNAKPQLTEAIFG